jgi:hypothetical protein
VTGYAAALALTLAVELPIYAVAFRRLIGLRSGSAALALAALVNLATHPLVWWTLHAAGGHRETYAISLLGVEVAAWLTEAAIAWMFLRRDAGTLVAIALAANAASFLAGLLLVR